MKIVGVKLTENGKVYYFDSSDVNVKENSTVIVETEKGKQYGTVVKFIPDELVDKRIDYKNVDIALNKEIERSLEFLKGALR